MLFRLFAENKTDEFASLGLPAALLQPLLEIQHRARCAGFKEAFPSAGQYMLLDESGEVTGQVLFEETAAWLRIVDIAIDSRHRGHGRGRSVLRMLQERARQKQKPLRLAVAVGSPALTFYKRLGFAELLQGPVYHEMMWQAEHAIEEPCA